MKKSAAQELAEFMLAEIEAQELDYIDVVNVENVRIDDTWKGLDLLDLAEKILNREVPKQ